MRRAIAIACCLAALPSWGYEVLKDSEGHPVAWAAPVTFVADEALAARLSEPRTMEAVQAAVSTFGGLSSALSAVVVSGEAQQFGFDTAPGAHNQNSVVAMQSWPFAAHNLAATVVTLNRRTHEIIDADIAFNTDEWRFRVLNPGNAPGDGLHDINDIQNTLTHELGHAFGLKHNDSDAQVVMFPAAPAGEVSKRSLAEDDRAGLLSLYPEPAASSVAGDPPPVGCSATGGGFDGALLGVLGFFFSRRRVLVAALAAALPLGARAEPPAAQPADRAALGEVTQLRSAWAPGKRLIFTDVEVAVRSCSYTPCEGRVVLRVPGGRVGDLEQVVSHNPVPEQGERVVVSWRQGRPALVRLPRP